MNGFKEMWALRVHDHNQLRLIWNVKLLMFGFFFFNPWTVHFFGLLNLAYHFCLAKICALVARSWRRLELFFLTGPGCYTELRFVSWVSEPQKELISAPCFLTKSVVPIQVGCLMGFCISGALGDLCLYFPLDSKVICIWQDPKKFSRTYLVWERLLNLMRSPYILSHF